VPKDIKVGERRPVVVCQHGVEGQPLDVITDDPESRAFQVYKSFAAKLADRGFVTFAPHNFYRGGNAFRQMQRKANPLKKTLWAITAVQHERILDWLSTLPFVDPKRIGFYGLSYGGNTAVRVPTLLDRYAVVISSGDFNEWIIKNVSVEDRYSFMFYTAYEVFEFNLGHTFNHGDLAGLIAPRPFMVERGHLDEVAPDEWVAGEYARVRRLYDLMGIPERTEIEFFNGPHTINGLGTFEFLHKHLHWPKERP
jgi:cephalosporin-C deacetylase-like acetyl esterase